MHSNLIDIYALQPQTAYLGHNPAFAPPTLESKSALYQRLLQQTSIPEQQSLTGSPSTGNSENMAEMSRELLETVKNLRKAKNAEIGPLVRGFDTLDGQDKLHFVGRR
jgi:hypothetical protein